MLTGQLWEPERVVSELRTNQGFFEDGRSSAKNGEEVNRIRGFHA